uniref:DUF834 domain-containing protein n=1 Tax=Setaria viridis TaxID=4556 RepID=A0A4U6TQP5_SETVI|nr:LOW QUALITY PROTEIN: hypothetical protein SEVIR_7G152700v2 [Setaria viridis]
MGWGDHSEAIRSWRTPPTSDEGETGTDNDVEEGRLFSSKPKLAAADTSWPWPSCAASPQTASFCRAPRRRRLPAMHQSKEEEALASASLVEESVAVDSEATNGDCWRGRARPAGEAVAVGRMDLRAAGGWTDLCTDPSSDPAGDGAAAGEKPRAAAWTREGSAVGLGGFGGVEEGGCGGREGTAGRYGAMRAQGQRAGPRGWEGAGWAEWSLGGGGALKGIEAKF